MNKIIKSDVKIIKKKDVHRLTLKYIYQRKTMCKLFFENYLAGEYIEIYITVDEVWMCLSDCNRKTSMLWPSQDFLLYKCSTLM